ncbi:MAG TPA: hypothetical protein VFB38_08645 [Chthonomonadaceae bacterium]|nr:hypothetical protein [Chthonomonadaceae bacterium]
MKAFSVRWRSARRFQEHEVFADAAVGACILAALEASGGMAVWQAGTLWKCPGCGDRTVRTEEFLEGMRRAEEYLQREEASCQRSGDAQAPGRRAALNWLAEVAAKMLGCERDRVYIKDEGGACAYEGVTYISRI